MLARRSTRSRFLALSVLCVTLGSPLEAQVPTNDPVEAHEKWFERSRERGDLIRGSFDVLRFDTGHRHVPRYERSGDSKRLITNADFWCTTCAREGRIPKDRAVREGSTLMDRRAPNVLDWIDKKVKGGSRHGTLLEDGQFKIWSDIGPLQVRKWPNRFLDEELEALSDVFPEVSDKTTALNRHQRTHLMLIRAHRLLRDFWWMAGTTPEAFAKKYDYLGPFLGMMSKQEVYLFARGRDYHAFATAFIGRTSQMGQCWHNHQTRAMVTLMTAERQRDPQTTNFFIHRLTHNLLDAYRVYGFKLPAWFQMGLAHWVERREHAGYNTFCFSEGTLPRTLLRTRWTPRIKKLVARDKARPLIEVLAFEEYGRFEPEEHMLTWSWVCFLWRLGPEKMPRFINALKDKKDGENWRDVQIKALRDVYGISPLQFDTAWREWVKEVYPSN